jgi:hypothetical protein
MNRWSNAEARLSFNDIFIEDDDDWFWKTREGKILRIRDMTDSHLLNCIKMMDSKYGPKYCEQHFIKYTNIKSVIHERGLDVCKEWDS